MMSFRLIRDELMLSSHASPGAIPRHLAALRANLKSLVLPPTRTDRIYPRAVKTKMSKLPRNRPTGSAK